MINSAILGRPVWSCAKDTAREHAVLWSIALIYLLSALIVSHTLGLPYNFLPNLIEYALLVSVPLAFVLCWQTIRVMIFVRPDRLTHYLFTSLKPYLDPVRLSFALPVLALIPVFGTTFTFYKSAISYLHPYGWDVRLTHLDAWLHGGIQPWVWLQPVLGHPLITGAINFFYNLWFFIVYAVLILQAFDTHNKRLRMRFYLSFLLTWILLGSVAATAFSSLGPCYDPGIAHHVGPYSGLMQYLYRANETIPIWALDTQQMLWRDYQHNRTGLGSGISAMPSVHVATATLLALFGWQYSRPYGIALTLFAVIIFLGSIHLGWHYAVDGYAAILGTLTIWWGVGRWQSRQALH
jgi:hypothetical protein